MTGNAEVAERILNLLFADNPLTGSVCGKQGRSLGS
jgi:hypothetical protein